MTVTQKAILSGKHSCNSKRRVLLLQGTVRHRKIKEQVLTPNVQCKSSQGGWQGISAEKLQGKSKTDRTHISSTISDFSLNEEQERAFKIVANHSVEPTSEQLLNAFGWNGRHRKIPSYQALISFFERRNKPYSLLDSWLPLALQLHLLMAQLITLC